ncbi:ATP-dependent DNA helicase PIF1-like [Diachasmimorpha longicaudata]|uniref:ATP-dependent DNA helicase PIF1-like n=1 Tax=Diachasmimorpha longicaudata TaxID=58733 RepID=UPI0030B8D01B
MNGKTAVTAPTGIAAFHINGLTIHRYFQLPIEHGDTPKYKQLSDNVLKLMREEMRDVELIIIDEISMVSNITFMYINQRLMEIFSTFDETDGWFGKKHILVFGDLLQLPPVLQDPTYIQLSSKEIEKRLGSMISVNLWLDLFSYDELTINMRQKKDRVYGELLSRLRVGDISGEDSKLLQSRKHNIQSSNLAERLRFLAEYIKSLPVDTIQLIVAMRLRNKAVKILEKAEQDDRSSAGLAKCITIKIGAKGMIRRNIDVTIGLVNGTIAVVQSISKSIMKGKEYPKAVTVKLDSGQTHDIERMEVKFEIMDGVYITRKQFPISLTYGITIHKSQGLRLPNAVMNIGHTVFSAEQSYVALSRVTTLEGVHLINFDPFSIKASCIAIQEYNRLRKEYRPDLPQISVSVKYFPKVWHFQWAFETGVIGDIEIENKKITIKSSVIGLSNANGASSFANTVIQCIFHSSVMRCGLSRIKNCGFLGMRTFLQQYNSGLQVLDATKLI